MSTSHHDQKPEVQLEQLRSFCNARGWAIAEEIVDHGFSGGNENRPGLRKLLALVRAREIDTVVVTKLDRLFRSLRNLLVVLEEFESLGVNFVATRDSVDWTTPSGRMFIQILGCLGEFERSLMRERTLAGLAHARNRGKILGRPKLRDDNAIFELRRLGLSYREINSSLGCSMGSIGRAIRSAPKTYIAARPKSAT